MVIGINNLPFKSGHSARGIGTYTYNLINELKKRKDIRLIEFSTNPPTNSQIIHYPYFDLYFHTLPIKKTIPRVITIHDVIPLIFPEKFPAGFRGKVNLRLQKIALKNSDAVICDSQASKQDIMKKLDFPQSKIFVIYLAPSSDFKKIEDKKLLNNVKEKHNLPEKFILYVGDVNWNKNILNLLKAMSITRIPLVMVGKALLNNDLPEVQEIERTIEDLKIQNLIFRLGFVETKDLVVIYNLAQSTILPSFYEGFGLPVLESMACGTPVICSNNSSLSEITNSTATYCDPENAKDIASKIIKVNRTKKESEKLINHSKKYSWKKVSEETINVYQKIVSAQ